jgi:protein-L-isoaspartate(D-aspartate) O-methyltransferase
MKKKLEKMLDTIRMEARYTASYTGRATFAERVMQAMQDVDRGDFVADSYKSQAYDNGPLPIGNGQTISQPYIVALMTDLLDVNADSVVLEVGTGSGYQAAILGKLVKQVYSVERISELAASSEKRLKQMGYGNIQVRCVNGYRGWQEKAPFDAIIVTAAATRIPQDLIDQLRPGGRMVIPVGLPYTSQELMLVTRNEQGDTDIESVLGVVFVPLVDDN